jgi:phosphoribosylformylglycinamidine synthase PurS subunit
MQRKNPKLESKKFTAKVTIAPKPTHHDPESETVQKSLLELGFEITRVRTSKTYTIELSSGSEFEAKEKVRDMCSKLLVNPVKDDYHVEIDRAA